MNYIIVDNTGVVVGGGSCQGMTDGGDVPVRPGCRVISGVEPPRDFMRRWRYVGGSLIDDGPAFVESYITKRIGEYPSMGDYLDAVVKGDQAAINAYIEKCLAVKAKYPKP